MDKITYEALANSSCVWGFKRCGMPSYSSSLLNPYSDIEQPNRFSLINTDNFPGPQFSSTPQRQRTQGQLHVDGSPGANLNTNLTMCQISHVPVNMIKCGYVPLTFVASYATINNPSSHRDIQTWPQLFKGWIALSVG